MNKDQLVDSSELEYNGELMGELHVYKDSKGMFYSTINDEVVKGSLSKVQGNAYQAGWKQFQREMRED